MSDETRRARVAYAFKDAGGSVTAKGNDEAVIDDAGVTVGSNTVAFLDADTFRARDYRIEIGCWPDGSLVLGELGRRFDTFTAELARSRNRARVAGMLAHGVSRPEAFPGAILRSSSAPPVECLVFDTHTTLVPTEDDPWQVPHGALTGIETDDEPPAVGLVTTEGRTTIGLLGRRRDEFLRTVGDRRQAQMKQLQAATGLPHFADGLGVERPRLTSFASLVTRWSAPDRAPGAANLVGLARGGEPRLGFVQLLDPDGEASSVPGLPEHWAAFLLVPAGPLTVLEILAGPSAATYVFEAPIPDVNRDLQLLHFRRGGLALSEAEGKPAPGHPYRLALRKLTPLVRLRAATRARIVHDDAWARTINATLSQ